MHIYSIFNFHETFDIIGSTENVTTVRQCGEIRNYNPYTGLRIRTRKTIKVLVFPNWLREASKLNRDSERSGKTMPTLTANFLAVSHLIGRTKQVPSTNKVYFHIPFN